MRAAVTTCYGPPEVVRLETRPDPRPGGGELLVQVTAAAVTRGDARIRGLDVPPGYRLPLRLALGWNRPRHPVQGAEFTGLVLRATGEFVPGQRVMGLTGLRGGAHAEQLVIAADRLVVAAPASLSDPEAAAFFFGGLTAAEFLIDKGKVKAGDRVLINGASGAVGSAGVQIARHLGARITARCTPEGAELAARLGAEQLAPRPGPLPDGPFDVVLDAVGDLDLAQVLPVLPPDGRFLRVVTGLWPGLRDALRPRQGGRLVIGGTVRETRAAMFRLLGLHAAGGYRPVLGPVLPFDRIAEAHAIAGSGRKRGNVVVTMG